MDLDLKFDKRYLNAYFARTEMGKMSKMSEIGDEDIDKSYFSVFRSREFKHDHWKAEIPDEVRGGQCDLMVRLIFNIWPFATMKISPKIPQISQSQLSILPNKK